MTRKSTCTCNCTHTPRVKVEVQVRGIGIGIGTSTRLARHLYPHLCSDPPPKRTTRGQVLGRYRYK